MAGMAADIAFTREDLDALPADGRRHELLDGAFLVTHSPGFAHQDVMSGSIEPSITVLELVDGAYTERAHLSGNETVDLNLPYPVELSARGLHPA